MVSVRAMASARSRIRSAVFFSTLARSYGVCFIQPGRALAAAASARFVSARLPNAISTMTSSIAGLMMPIVRPSWAAHHWPSMYIFFMVAAAVAVGMAGVSDGGLGSGWPDACAKRKRQAAVLLIVTEQRLAARGAVALVRAGLRTYPD